MADFIDGLTLDQFKALISDLNPKRVAKRKQGGSDLSYLEAWDVRASLIRVFGFGGWDAEVLREQLVTMETDVPKANGGSTAFRATVMVTLRLHVHQLHCVYTEVAASSQSGAVPGDVLDFALKTAASDALKRCAMNLGTQFGLSLYNKGATRDIVGIVFEPTQAGYLKELTDAKTEKVDPTPAHALEGIGEVEEFPNEEEAPPKERDYLMEAAKLKTSAEVVVLWREAKAQFGGNDNMVITLGDIAKDLKHREDDEKEAEAAVSDARATAAAAVAGGFGG